MNVMVKCPKTGKLVHTGISMDKKSFDTAKLENNTVGCPECGGKHVWSKEGCSLEGLVSNPTYSQPDCG